jgi:hypothetical protein
VVSCSPCSRRGAIDYYPNLDYGGLKPHSDLTLAELGQQLGSQGKLLGLEGKRLPFGDVGGESQGGADEKARL